MKNIRLEGIKMVESCSNCLYDIKHPFGLSLSQNKCTGCITHEEKYQIDWSKKEEELKSLLEKYKKRSKVYDCVVPVVGDAEDYYVLSKVLELGMSPLVVSVNDYFKNDIGWHNLHHLITYFDVDSIVYNPDIRVYKELVRTSLRKYDHILLPFLQLYTSFPVHIAKERKIPLIIWGQNQSVEQVGKFSHHDKVQMSEWSRKEHDLFGNDIDTLIGNGAQVQERDLNYYQYPKISDLEKSGVKGIYLSNYMKWDPLKQNHSTLEFGFKPQENSSSFDIYERAGSSVYYQLHDLLKYKRIGYRKVRDHLTREIRHGRIDKKQAQEVESSYNKNKVDVSGFFNWLGMTQSAQEWFIMHKLNGLEHLIGKSDSSDIKLSNKINEKLVCGEKERENFIVFGKGISI
ncbi:N-acetyl sugar amidotransferase [Aliarcobacter butzleri]